MPLCRQNKLMAYGLMALPPEPARSDSKYFPKIEVPARTAGCSVTPSGCFLLSAGPVAGAAAQATGCVFPGVPHRAVDSGQGRRPGWLDPGRTRNLPQVVRPAAPPIASRAAPGGARASVRARHTGHSLRTAAPKGPPALAYRTGLWTPAGNENMPHPCLRTASSSAPAHGTCRRPDACHPTLRFPRLSP